MKQRIRQIQGLLAQRDLAAAVLRLPENVVLCSGYFPRNAFSLVFIPAKGDAWLVAPEGDQDDPEQGSIRNIRRFGWVRLQDGNPYVNVGKVLAGLKERCEIVDGAGVGVDANSDVISPCLCFGEMLPPGRATLDMVARTFRTDRVVEIMPDIRQLRAVKFPEELERIEIANEVAYVGLDRFIALASKPGVREVDLAAEVEACVAVQGPGHRGKARFARAIAQVTSGPERTAAAWFAGMVSTTRRTQSGDLVMLEVGVTVDGFWADLTKTVVVGSPSREQATMLSAVEQAQRAALEHIRPGRTAGEVDATARAVVAHAGLEGAFCHALGHGVGLAYHDGDPVFVPGASTVLQPGMVFSCEPGVYVDGKGGVRQEVNVVVTTDGCRVLGRNN